MSRRLTALLAVWVVALVATWLLWNRGAERTLAPERAPARPEASQENVPAVEPDEASTVAPESQREAAAPTEPAEGAEAKAAKPLEEESAATLIVRTIDKESGAPLAGVRLTVSPRTPGSGSTHVDGSKGTLRTSPRTNTDGWAEFELPTGVELELWTLGDRAKIGETSREISPLEPGERRVLSLELPTGDDLHFFLRVLAREDKTPVAGATIELLRAQTRITRRGEEKPEEQSIVTTLASGVTDSNGCFDLWIASWKNPDVRVRAAGFGKVLLQAGTEHETPEKARVVLLSRGASLRARILDAGSAPLAEGVVRLWTESYQLGESDHGEIYLPSLSDQEWRESADSSGSCAVHDLPPDVPFHVEILRGGRVVKKDLPSLSLKAGEVREVEWRIGSGCRIEGSVVDQQGERVPHQALWLERAAWDVPTVFQESYGREVIVETETDADGRFAFSDVSPGKWWIGPAAEREDRDAPDPQGIAPVAQVFEILEGQPRQEILLRVHRGLYIRGRVLDPAGEPAPGTYVMGRGDALFFSVRSGPDGAFALGPLAPGRYSLVANGWTDADSRQVEASAGDEGVVLRLEPGGTLSGTIVDGASGRRCAARISFAVRDPSNQGFSMSGGGEDGTFRLQGLAAGTYDLAARASGGRVGLLRGISLEAGGRTENLVVTLTPGAMLRIRNAGKDGYLHYRVLCDGVIVAGDGVPAGGRSETAVPAGHVVVECQWGRTTETKEIELAVGEEKDLALGSDG